jgi:SecD/SecF fusion protein
MRKLVFFLFILPLFTNPQTNTKYFYLKAKQAALSQGLIDSTVNTLNTRLLKNGYKSTIVSFDNASEQFVITANDFIDSNYIKLWLIKPFRISIYELYTFEELISLLSQVKIDKARNDKVLNFYQLLNITAENYQSLKFSSFLGTLELQDTARFRMLIKDLEPYLPGDIFFAFPRKRSYPNIPVLEVYGLKMNKFKIEVNELLLTANSGEDASGHPSIKFEFNRQGQELFLTLTEKNNRRPIAITIDNRVCTAPFVQGKIEGGAVEISGAFEKKEAKEIADMLSTGCLPVNLTFNK